MFRRATLPPILTPPPRRRTARRGHVPAAHVLATMALLGVAALSAAVANGALSPAMAAEAVFGDLDAPADAVTPMPFERPGDSFPGSAYYYLADPAPPPPAPVQTLAPAAHWDDQPAAPALDIARPIAIANPRDRTRALACMTAAIYYEAATEPDDGQRAVAQVILNRLAHPSYPKTVCDVVYQGSERASGCQFTFSCDGAMARVPMRFFWDRAMAVAQAALAGSVYAPVGLATHYHTFAVHPPWADSLDFIGQIGAHRFYRMEGPAGATAAFRFAYAGGEPLPGPHPRSLSPAIEASPDPLAVEHAYAQGLHAAAADPSEIIRATGDAGLRLNGDPAPRLNGDFGLRPNGDPGLRLNGDPARRLNDAAAASSAGAAVENRAVRPEYQHSGAWIAQPQ